MMEAVSTSETSVNFYQTTRCTIPEDSHLQFLLFHFSIRGQIFSLLYNYFMKLFSNIF
jgi:hypothetical protein